MFGREKYSKEGYEALEKQTAEAEAGADQNPGRTVPTGMSYTEKQFSGGHTVRDEHRTVPSSQQERFWKLREKLEKMKTAGHSEALELEAKHNQLIKGVEDAQASLDAFEKEQLGMDRE